MTTNRHEDQLSRWAASGKAGSEPVQAATVVLVRDTADGLESLMLRRNSKIAFGGMWVFPGGRVDPGDAEGVASDDELAVACRAAVREAQEEVGLVLEPAHLAPYSHWTPPPITPRRFLTWFFLAAAPSGRVTVDGGEIHEHAWMQPSLALQKRDAGEIELAPPTWVTLHELSRFRSVDEALSTTRGRDPERFETQICVEEHGPTALWHGDAGWPDRNVLRPGPRHRLCMHASGWRYERSR